MGAFGWRATRREEEKEEATIGSELWLSGAGRQML